MPGLDNARPLRLGFYANHCPPNYYYLYARQEAGGQSFVQFRCENGTLQERPKSKMVPESTRLMVYIDKMTLKCSPGLKRTQKALQQYYDSQISHVPSAI